MDRAQLQRLAQEVEALRKRLEEINLRIDQVDVVLAEHTITDAVLETLPAHDAGASISTHLPIGSGVSLPYRHQDPQEGTALVDLGAGVSGERSWNDVRALTQQRQADIQRLRDELKQQSEQTETSLGQAAQSFNRLAEQLKQTPSAGPTGAPPIEAPTSMDEGIEEPASEPQNRRTRRRGMFGGDLTLDD